MTINQKITDYKNKVASRYIPVDAEQMLQKIMEAEYYLVSQKYDGHFGVLEIKKGTATLYNRNGELPESVYFQC